MCIRDSDVRVILFNLDSAGLKQVWQDPERLQRNPQYTDHTGQYSFFVPAGDYVLEATGPGFDLFSSGLMQLEQDLQYVFVPVFLAIESGSIDNIVIDQSVIAMFNRLRDVINDLQVDAEIIKLTKNIIKPLSIVLLIVTLVTYFFSLLSQLGLAFTQLPSIGFHVFQLLVQIFGGKKMKNKWGRVYENLTRDPIPVAAVMLFHEPDHKMLQITLSEPDGTYGFKLYEGKCSVFAHRKGFEFPVQSTETIYKGEAFQVIKDTAPHVNLAMSYVKGALPETKPMLVISSMMNIGHFGLIVGGIVLSSWTLLMQFTLLPIFLIIGYIWLLMTKLSILRNTKEIMKIAYELKDES